MKILHFQFCCILLEFTVHLHCRHLADACIQSDLQHVQRYNDLKFFNHQHNKVAKMRSTKDKSTVASEQLENDLLRIKVAYK